MGAERSRSWWIYLLEGLLTVFFGLIVIAWPGLTLFTLIVLFGVLAMTNGISRLVASFAKRREGRSWWLLITGVASVATGIVAFAWPGVTGRVLLFIIALYAVFAGAATIAGIIGSGSTGREKLLALLRGGSAIAFGALAFFWPGATALSLTWAIGIYAVLFGISGIAFSFMARREQGNPASAG